MKLSGALARRGNEPVGRYCPIERSLLVVGTRSAILVLREAFYGATRFEEFVARSGLTASAASSRLRDLVKVGVLEKRPYQDPGLRRRSEYVLTPAGRELMPALFALFQWANRHDPPPYPPTMHHDGCGEPVTVTASCAAAHVVTSDEITVSASGPFGLENPIAAT